MIVLFALMAVCAVVPAVLFVVNLRAYRPPPAVIERRYHIAVLIPARNEEANIRAALECVLASTGVTVEVIVLDDASTDSTPKLVGEMSSQDPRLTLIRSVELPGGWNGKQHACWQLAQQSTAPVMLFLDADVRLAPDAIARMAAFQHTSGAALVSGFPRLITVSFLEWLLLPLIHFVLLGFLPVHRMRSSNDPSMAAGCGQFMMVEREAYFASGGHAAIRATMHDGLLLPRAFRRAGYRTDLADITNLARVRMYDSAAKVWQGLAKNATEGIAAPARIAPITLLLFLGQILPTLLLLIAFTIAAFIWRHHVFIFGIPSSGRAITFTLFFAITLVASYLPRLLSVRRFKQPLRSALLHPLGITLLLCVQWYALIRQILGRPVGWRQRDYASSSGGEVREPG